MNIDNDLAHSLKRRMIKDTEEVLEALEQHISDKDSSLYTAYVLASADYEELKKRRLYGTIGDDADSIINKIRCRILSIIDELKPKKNTLAAPAIKDILVICKAADRVSVMDHLVRLGNYENVYVPHKENLPQLVCAKLSIEEANQYNLIIFDNFPIAASEEEEELLRYYLNETKPLLLYFGPHLDLLKQYPEKAYFSNSIFSIHSRIEELLRFDRMTKGKYQLTKS